MVVELYIHQTTNRADEIIERHKMIRELIYKATVLLSNNRGLYEKWLEET